MIKVNSQLINSICATEDIKFLGFFGSQSRGEAQGQSDVDLLVDFFETKSFFELGRIQEKFEQVFDKKVDFVLKPALHAAVFRDLITLYGQRWLYLPARYL